MDYHNPQAFSQEEIDPKGSYRLLTVEEIAVLTDYDPANNSARDALWHTLRPEIYHEGACRWIGHDFGQPIREDVTYRTLYALTVASEPEADKVTGDEMLQFGLLFDLVASQSHSDMRKAGFWKGRDDLEAAALAYGGPELQAFARNAIDGQSIALIASEGSEWLEGLRDGNPPDDKIPEFTAAEAEAADIVIRVMDTAGGRGMRVGQAIIAKIARNRARQAMHGRQF